jgi:hypothetical protein
LPHKYLHKSTKTAIIFLNFFKKGEKHVVFIGIGCGIVSRLEFSGSTRMGQRLCGKS